MAMRIVDLSANSKQLRGSARRILSRIPVGTLWPTLALAITATACGGPDPMPGGNPGPVAPAVDPGTPVTADLPAETKQALSTVKTDLAAVANLGADQFASRYAVSFAPALGYDPSTAAGLDRIQASTLALNAAELAKLKEQGFVISERLHYPTFVHGYKELYVQHLPLYVSVDSILEGVHRSYDSILKSLEVGDPNSLKGKLDALFAGARTRLASAPPSESRADLDVYLTVAASLLSGTATAPVAGGDAKLVSDIVAAAAAHTGTVTVNLFGTGRAEDFSQYKPRGHYTDSAELGRYFQAMMWLGRTDFRFLETQPDGTQLLRRRQVAAAFALREMVGAPELAAYQGIDSVIRAFVGEPDFMTLEQLDQLKTDLGIADAAGLAALSDQTLTVALGKVGYGKQRILSTLMENGGPVETLPLSLSFALLGQRYVIDSHVFSNVVWDRTAAMRMMPNPLDAAFAALGSDEAGSLLMPELQQYGYAPQLASMRVLADDHGADFWQANLYNLWLGSLRTLSASGDVASGTAAGLPAVATTEPWARRVLNAQLASWAELRHNTILYAKQSYTTGSMCAFPDAFVDPYPKFFSAIEAFAARGRDVMAGFYNAATPSYAETYFAGLGTVASTLRQMAEAELAGAQFTAEQMAFINEAVSTVNMGCTADTTQATGWYAKLYYDTRNAYELDPTIADVHTQPTDEAGNMVGRVLHVATGQPRTMVVSIDRCGMPSAYVGFASSYFEKTTSDFQRMDDGQWTTEIQNATPADVPWMTGIVTR